MCPNGLHPKLYQAKQNPLTDKFHNLLHKLSQRYNRLLDELPQAKRNKPTNATYVLIYKMLDVIKTECTFKTQTKTKRTDAGQDRGDAGGASLPHNLSP